MSERRIIRRLRGRGVVWNCDNRVASVDYEIDEWQEFSHIQPLGGADRQEVTGLTDYTGVLVETGDGKLPLPSRDALLLELSDGSFLDFFMERNLDDMMMSWSIVCTGDIRPVR